MRVYNYLQKRYGHYEYLTISEAKAESLMTTTELKAKLKINDTGVKMADLAALIEETEC